MPWFGWRTVIHWRSEIRRQNAVSRWKDSGIGSHVDDHQKISWLALEAKRTAKIEFITEFSCELV